MAFDTARRDELTAVLEADDFSAAAWDAVGTTRTWGDADAHHRAAIEEAVEPLDDVAVVVDVGNGAGSVTADALRALGCSVETLNDRPDGRFPSRPSEPTEEACQTLQATVAATEAALGVAHDGDADRMLAVDETGAFVGGDALLALFGRATATPGDRIAAPVNTSRMVDAALADVGADVVRTRVGDVFVAEQARDDGVVFGGEPSGAWIWPTHTPAPDGVLAAARLAALIDTDGPLSTQVATLEQYPIRRDNIETQNKQAVMRTVTETILDRYDEEAVQQLDGVRIEEPQGWILIRASGTQPLVRVTAEGTTDEEADELCSEARALVEAAL
jgi:phosphoglucosamine mutase